MNTNKTTTRTYFQIVTGFIGNHPNSYCSETFTTKEDAENYFNAEYKNRNKKDGYDDYWNNKNMVIQKVTNTIETIIDKRTPEQIAETHVHSIEGVWLYLLNGKWSAPFNTKEDCINAFIGQINQSGFLKEWQPFEQLNRMVKRTLVSHFIKNTYQWQPTNNEQDKRPFKIYSFSGIDEKLGLAYTSTGDYAGLWICNAGYLWADPTHYFIGFAINKDNEVIGIAQDFEENEIFVNLV